MSTPTAGSSGSPAPASPAPAVESTSSGGCAHCDGSVPHRHLDVASAVREADARLAARGRRDLAVGVTLLAVTTIVSLVTLPTPLGAMIAALVGLSGWGFAMALGLGVVGLYGRARPGSVERAADGRTVGAPRQAAVLAGMAVSLLVPPTGYLAAFAGGTAWAALTGAGAWLGVAGMTQSSSSRSVREMLATEGPQGEAARQAAVHGELPQGLGLGWLWHGVGVGVWGLLAAALPLTLVATVPLHVALTLLASRRAVAARR